MNAIALQPRHVFSILVLLTALVLGLQSSYKHAAAPLRNVKEVTVPEAKAMIDAGAIVIDVRDRAVSGRTHLPGAMQIPVELLAASLAKLEYAKAQQIVVYCGDGSTRGPEAATILTQAGFAQTVNLKAGIEGWRSAGLPVASS